MEQSKNEATQQNNATQDQDIRKGTEPAKEQTSGEQTQRDGKAAEEVRKEQPSPDQGEQAPTTGKL